MVGMSSLRNGYSYLKKGIYNVTHFAEIEAAKPQIKLGWQYKGKDGKLVEATLSQDAINALPKVTKGMLATMIGSLILGSANRMVVKAENVAKIPKNIMMAKTKSLAKDSIIFDTKIPIPAKLASFVKVKGSQAEKFYNSLRSNKDSLMKDLDLSSEKYNDYAITAMKIAKEESALGLSKKYKMYEVIQNDETGIKVLSEARDLLAGDGTLSLGMTRYKIGYATEKEKALFDKYGITYDNFNSNILEPEKSAVATMIHLAELGKGYPKYLESVRALKPDTTSVAAKESIKNAKEILFNDLRRPSAIAHIRPSEIEGETAMLEKFTPRELDDLKFYASTIELSEPAYLAARWNGKRVIPSGESKDIACANLLNIAAQKGYISNIDKTSKVAY